MEGWRDHAMHRKRSRSVKPAAHQGRADVVNAARDFLYSWLVRKQYDAAVRCTSLQRYMCATTSNVIKASHRATSPEDVGRKLRAGLEAAGRDTGNIENARMPMVAADQIQLSNRVMDHPFARVFSPSSLPNALADAPECAARASNSASPDPCRSNTAPTSG